MPYEKRKQNGKICVYNKITGEKKSCFTTEKEANDYIAALMANENAAIERRLQKIKNDT